MPRTKTMGRAANGVGSIRKKSVQKNGKTYTYYEARATVGYDHGTGKQIQRSITGKTQKEVREKLQEISVDINNGIYREPSKMTVGQWLDTWQSTYLEDVKPRTKEIYTSAIRLHLKPALGAVQLEALDAPTIQQFYNALGKPSKMREQGLSPKTVKSLHGILHRALSQAVKLGYLRYNPSDACTLPKAQRKEFIPLDSAEIAAFLKEINGTRLEALLTLTLFTGMREGEVLGLTWDCVNFASGTISIKQQLQRFREPQGVYHLVPTKNGKGRLIAPPVSIMELLKHHKAAQAQEFMQLGIPWEGRGYVFTNEAGEHLDNSTVYRACKAAVTAIGRPDARFHDLRHSYAVAAIRSGDDIKTVQSNLGHATAAFTLDVYGHYNDEMRQASAARMERFFKSVSVG